MRLTKPRTSPISACQWLEGTDSLRHSRIDVTPQVRTSAVTSRVLISSSGCRKFESCRGHQEVSASTRSPPAVSGLASAVHESGYRPRNRRYRVGHGGWPGPRGECASPEAPAGTHCGRPSTGPVSTSPDSVRMAGVRPVGCRSRSTTAVPPFYVDVRRREADVVGLGTGADGSPSWSARQPRTRRFPVRTEVRNIAHRVPHAHQRDPARATPPLRPTSSRCCSTSGRRRHAARFGGSAFPGERGRGTRPSRSRRGRGGHHATSGLFLPAGEDVGCDGIGEVPA